MAPPFERMFVDGRRCGIHNFVEKGSGRTAGFPEAPASKGSILDAAPIERIALDACRAAVQESGWPQVLDDIRHALDAKTAVLLAPRRTAPVLMLGPPDFTREHREKVIAMPDPWGERLAQLRQTRPTGECRIGSSYLPFSDLERSGYFEAVTDEVIQVGPVVTLYIEGDDSASGLPPTHLTVVRGPRERDFTDETRRFLKAVHAPLRAAVRNYWAFTRIRQLERAPEVAYHALPQPVLVLRPDAGIEYANAAGDALLARGDLVCASGGHLVRAGAHGAATLQLLVSAASRGMAQQVSVCASGDAGSARGVLHVSRLPPDSAFEARWPRGSVLATIQLQPAIGNAARIPALARRFGFTPTESDVLRELSSGATAMEIAQRRHVRVSTVRTQIRGLLDKSGSRRQSELLRLVLG